MQCSKGLRVVRPHPHLAKVSRKAPVDGSGWLSTMVAFSSNMLLYGVFSVSLHGCVLETRFCSFSY